MSFYLLRSVRSGVAVSAAMRGSGHWTEDDMFRPEEKPRAQSPIPTAASETEIVLPHEHAAEVQSVRAPSPAPSRSGLEVQDHLQPQPQRSPSLSPSVKIDDRSVAESSPAPSRPTSRLHHGSSSGPVLQPPPLDLKGKGHEAPASSVGASMTIPSPFGSSRQASVTPSARPSTNEVATPGPSRLQTPFSERLGTPAGLGLFEPPYKQYFRAHNILDLVDELIIQLAITKPVDPKHFIVEWLCKRFNREVPRRRTSVQKDSDKAVVLEVNPPGSPAESVPPKPTPKAPEPQKNSVSPGKPPASAPHDAHNHSVATDAAHPPAHPSEPAAVSRQRPQSAGSNKGSRRPSQLAQALAAANQPGDADEITLKVTVLSAKDLRGASDTSTPCVRLSIGDVRHTSTVKTTGANPVWQESFSFSLSGTEQSLDIVVYHISKGSAPIEFGRSSLRMQSILENDADEVVVLPLLWRVGSADWTDSGGKLLLTFSVHKHEQPHPLRRASFPKSMNLMEGAIAEREGTPTRHRMPAPLSSHFMIAQATSNASSLHHMSRHQTEEVAPAQNEDNEHIRQRLNELVAQLDQTRNQVEELTSLQRHSTKVTMDLSSKLEPLQLPLVPMVRDTAGTQTTPTHMKRPSMGVGPSPIPSPRHVATSPMAMSEAGDVEALPFEEEGPPPADVPLKSKRDTVRVLVAFYSTYGHIYTLAQAVAQGAASVPDTIVDIKRIPETLPDRILEQIDAKEAQKLWKDIPEITIEDIEHYDCFLFGFPTRFGTPPQQVVVYQELVEQQLLLRQQESLPLSLADKVGGVFVSTGTQHGGHETTALHFLLWLVNIGFNIVGVPNQFPKEEKTVHGGSPYGAGTIAGPMADRVPSGTELATAFTQGQWAAKAARSIVLNS